MASNENIFISRSGIMSQHEMFHAVGDQLTSRDVQKLVHHYRMFFSDEMRALITDGYNFLLAMKTVAKVDNSDILKILRIINRHDLAQFVNFRRRKPVEMDPVDEYLEQTAKSNVIRPSWLQKQDSWGVQCRLNSFNAVSSGSNQASTSQQASQSTSTTEPENKPAKSASVGRRKRKRSSLTYTKHKRSKTSEPQSPSTNDVSTSSQVTEDNRRITRSRSKSLGGLEMAPTPSVVSQRRPTPAAETKQQASQDSQLPISQEAATPSDKTTLGKSYLSLEEIKKKVTCDIRLRVRAEYCYHDNALEGNIFSNKPELIERQFEKFMQANTILKSRDLGSIICDIKFSELTYLDAFWRDYINGSLLEALKGVFITDSLKQAVGHEAIKLLVNVDEDDYEAGRFKLLQNLKD